jgi:hypothetical protein
MSVIPNNNPVKVHFLYGRSPKPTDLTSGGAREYAPRSQLTHSLGLTDLEPDTTYYYRAVATNSGGEVESDSQSFTTAADVSKAPVIDRTQAYLITDNSAGLNMVVINHGIQVEVCFLYGTDPHLAKPTQTKARTLNGVATGIWNWQYLPELSSRTKYYFQAVAQNSAGKDKSDIMSFTTLKA